MSFICISLWKFEFFRNIILSMLIRKSKKVISDRLYTWDIEDWIGHIESPRLFGFYLHAFVATHTIMVMIMHTKPHRVLGHITYDKVTKEFTGENERGLLPYAQYMITMGNIGALDLNRNIIPQRDLSSVNALIMSEFDRFVVAVPNIDKAEGYFEDCAEGEYRVKIWLYKGTFGILVSDAQYEICYARRCYYTPTGVEFNVVDPMETLHDTIRNVRMLNKMNILCHD